MAVQTPKRQVQKNNMKYLNCGNLSNRNPDTDAPMTDPIAFGMITVVMTSSCVL